MHLLSTKAMPPKHSYFKRKSLKSKAATLASEDSTTTCSVSATTTSAVDGEPHSSGSGCAAGMGGGLAKASKLKLKMGLSKTNSKLKLTQKFHWLRHYVRSDAAVIELGTNFAQSLSNQRLNSFSTNGITTKPTITPTTIIATPVAEEGKTTTTTTTTSEPIIGSLALSACSDDYYSSICDNQLSFNNSPCKSPRSLVDIAIINNILHKTSNLVQQQQQQQFLLTTTTTTTCTSATTTTAAAAAAKIVVVAARPAKMQAIGFNVAATESTAITPALASATSVGKNSESSGGSTATTTSGSSCYGTPLTSLSKADTSPFVFPNNNNNNNNNNNRISSNNHTIINHNNNNNHNNNSNSNKSSKKCTASDVKGLTNGHEGEF